MTLNFHTCTAFSRNLVAYLQILEPHKKSVNNHCLSSKSQHICPLCCTQWCDQSTLGYEPLWTHTHRNFVAGNCSCWNSCQLQHNSSSSGPLKYDTYIEIDLEANLETTLQIQVKFSTQLPLKLEGNMELPVIWATQTQWPKHSDWNTATQMHIDGNAQMINFNKNKHDIFGIRNAPKSTKIPRNLLPNYTYNQPKTLQMSLSNGFVKSWIYTQTLAPHIFENKK